VIGTDWLRRKAADVVRIEEAPPALLADPLIDLSDATAEDAQWLAERLEATFGVKLATNSPPTAAEPMRCPCGVIYSRCYYRH
jgi:hypothetical protein